MRTIITTLLATALGVSVVFNFYLLHTVRELTLQVTESAGLENPIIPRSGIVDAVNLSARKVTIETALSFGETERLRMAINMRTKIFERVAFLEKNEVYAVVDEERTLKDLAPGTSVFVSFRKGPGGELEALSIIYGDVFYTP